MYLHILKRLYTPKKVLAERNFYHSYLLKPKTNYIAGAWNSTWFLQLNPLDWIHQLCSEPYSLCAAFTGNLTKMFFVRNRTPLLLVSACKLHNKIAKFLCTTHCAWIGASQNVRKKSRYNLFPSSLVGLNENSWKF